MAKFGIGQAVRRVEDQRFLLGQGRYVDDISLPGQCYGVTVLSPHAHARIKRVDVAKAKAAQGVLCVLTGADAVAEKLGSFTAHLMPEDFGAPKGHRTFQPVLNGDKVRFVGDRVAFVVAETLTQARDAAELVEVDYEPLPAVVNLEDAAKDGAGKVWDDCTPPTIPTRSTPLRRIRTACAWKCRTSSMCPKIASAWLLPMSAAASASRATRFPTTRWCSGLRAACAAR